MNNAKLMEYLESNRVGRARMIEYDADSVQPILLKLLGSGTKVELLLQHPEHTISERQRSRVIAQIQKKDELPNQKRLKIRYYKDRASIRGRKFDSQLLSIGWYTYDRRREFDPESQVTGHANPVMQFSLQYPEGRRVCAMFDMVFDNLWRDSEEFDKVAPNYPITSPTEPPSDVANAE